MNKKKNLIKELIKTKKINKEKPQKVTNAATKFYISI